MKRMIKLMTSVGIIFGLTMVISVRVGCTGSSDTTASKDKPLAIQCLNAFQPKNGLTLAMNDAANLYMKTHPEFKFSMEIIPDGNAYLQKLKIYAGSDALPDWFFGDPDTFMQRLKQKDTITNIGELLKELGVEDKFSKITLDYHRFDDGSLYLMGLGANTEYFWYHKSMLEKVGAKPPRTFDDLLAVCDKLKAAGITPMVSKSGSYFPVLRLTAMVPFRMTGNQFINKAKLGEVKFNSAAGLAAGNFIQKLAGYFQEGWAGVDMMSAINYFLSGKAAMMYLPSDLFTSFCCDANLEVKEGLAYFPMPVLGSGDATAPTDYFANPGKGIAILKSSMNDKMKDYMKFFITNYGDLAVKNNFIPGIKPNSTKGFSNFYTELLGNFLNVKNYAACWDVKLDTATCEVMKREVENLALGKISPEEWAKRIDDAVAKNAPEAFGLKK
jgi:raffinose/stachyose/melibiose transport system substrate-binding protein